MFDEYDDLLNVDDLCSLLSIGKNTAYTLLKEKKIKAFQTGKSWKIPKLAVINYVMEQSKLASPSHSK